MSANIYLETNYRKIIRDLVSERKKYDRGFNFQKMAEFALIQKSYLSKVLKGSAELNADQLFLICEYLGLKGDAKIYLNLLLEYSRSSIKRRRDQLLLDINAFRSKSLETKEYLRAGRNNIEGLDTVRYYLDPLNQLVHIGLSIPKYNANILALAKDLDVSEGRIVSVINILENLSIVKKADNRITILIPDIHLPHDSEVYKTWVAQIRLKSLQKFDKTASNQAYSFSVTFSADEDTRLKIQSGFMDYLKKTEAQVKSAPSKHIYQLNFDLFSWTK